MSIQVDISIPDISFTNFYLFCLIVLLLYLVFFEQSLYFYKEQNK